MASTIMYARYQLKSGYLTCFICVAATLCGISAGENVYVLMLAVPPFLTKIFLSIWAWISTGP